MRVDSAAIGMESDRRYTSISGRTTRLVITSGRQSLNGGTGTLSAEVTDGGAEEEGTQTEETQSPQKALRSAFDEFRAMTKSFGTGNIRDEEVSSIQEQLMELRQQCLNYLMDILFPQRNKRAGYKETAKNQSQNQGMGGMVSTSDMLASTVGVGFKAFHYSTQYYRQETESTSYSTTGTVKCADGREISFNLNLEMSRSFQEYYEENISATQVNMCDPLVINLSGNIADLSDQTFLFDLDGDGQEDEINRLSAGSGYLALDKNGDGVINDGTELFGTQSGNGFADLAAYDTDHNGFIDEGDEIWDKLKIWVTDEKGNQQLYSLAEKGVGAICLQNSATDYAITDSDNQTKGVIRSTGVFLYENGNVGTVQHVDLALHEQNQKEHREQEKIRQNQGKYEKWLYDMAM